MVRENDSKEVANFVENHQIPYFLHPSDNSILFLVQQQLNGPNYISWSRSMITVLVTKKKLSFVDGLLPTPHLNDALFQIWTRSNNMVVSWIRHYVYVDIYSSLMSLRFGQIFELVSVKPISWCTCDESRKKFSDYHQQECVLQFLIGLN